MIATDWSAYDRCARCGASAGDPCLRLDVNALDRIMFMPWPHDGRPPRTGNPRVNAVVDKLYGDTDVRAGLDDLAAGRTVPADVVRADVASRAELHEQTAELRQSLGVLIHTGLRKVAGSTASWDAWKAIDAMEPEEWDDVLRYVVEGLSGGGW